MRLRASFHPVLNSFLRSSEPLGAFWRALELPPAPLDSDRLLLPGPANDIEIELRRANGPRTFCSILFRKGARGSRESRGDRYLANSVSRHKRRNSGDRRNRS